MEQIDELRRRELQLASDLGFAQNADEEATIRAQLDRGPRSDPPARRRGAGAGKSRHI
jgi:hypothetical protein